MSQIGIGFTWPLFLFSFHLFLHLTDNICPAAGEMLITGNNSNLKITFAADKSIDLFLNGTLGAEFASCNEFSPATTVTIAGR